MAGFERLRLLAGMTMTDAAKALNVSVSTVSGWENKGRRPHPNMLKDIATAYDCSIEDIVNAYEAQN